MPARLSQPLFQPLPQPLPARLHAAEYVSPGHPDRLADAVAEACVGYARALDPEAVAGIEVAVSSEKVFVSGCLALGAGDAGRPQDFLPPLVQQAYAAAGYGEAWRPAPRELVVIHDLSVRPLGGPERAARHWADDQAICVGYACDSPSTDWQPPVQWLALRLGERLAAWRAAHAADRLGPDFKLLPVLEEVPAAGAGRRWRWRRLVLSIQHLPSLCGEDQLRLLFPVLHDLLQGLDGALPGVGSLGREQLRLNPGGAFTVGGPHGDNGLSGKKLVVDGYGPGVPIGGGAHHGKDPHKVDRRGAQRARELALEAVRAGAPWAQATLVYTPGEREPEVSLERGAGRATWLDALLAGQA